MPKYGSSMVGIVPPKSPSFRYMFTTITFHMTIKPTSYSYITSSYLSSWPTTSPFPTTQPIQRIATLNLSSKTSISSHNHGLFSFMQPNLPMRSIILSLPPSKPTIMLPNLQPIQILDCNYASSKNSPLQT